MAGLNVGGATSAGFDALAAGKFLDKVKCGPYGSQFGYTDANGAIAGGHATSAIGLLCRQYLGTKPRRPHDGRGREVPHGHPAG